MLDAAGVGLLALVGALLLRAVGPLPHMGMVGLSLPVGGAAYTTLGLILTTVGLPARPWALLPTLGALSFAGWVLARWRAGTSLFHGAGELLVVAVISSAALVLAAAFEALGLASFTPDSFRYVVTATLLGQDGTLDAAPGYLLKDRGFSLPVLHGLAAGEGPGYLASLGPLTALSSVATLAWAGHSILEWDKADRGTRWALVVAVIAAVLTINRFVFHAFYINGHMLFGAWLLILGLAAMLLARGENRALRRPLLMAATLSVAALVPLRLEGAVIVGLLLLATAVTTGPDSWSRFLFLILALSVGAWYGIIVPRGYEAAGNEVPFAVTVLVAGAVGAVLFAAYDWWRARAWPRGVLLVAHLLLWTVLAAFSVADPGPLRQGLIATASNLAGPGLWGVSLPLGAFLLAVVFATRRFRGMAILVFPMASFLPLAFLLSYLGGPTYRVAPGDSLNRMWTHFLLLAALALLAAGSSSSTTGGLAIPRILRSRRAATHARREPRYGPAPSRS